MELIDREALSKELCNKCGRKDCTAITDIEICIAQFVINTMEAVDAVPVVRCGECCYSSFVKSISKYMCEKCNGFMRYSDDYCSYGERKTDAR